MKRNNRIKEYFAEEVNRRKAPPFPEKKRTAPKRRALTDGLMPLAAAAALIALTLWPGLYENRLRDAHMTRNCYEELRESFPRTVYTASAYMREKNNQF
ncbi:MAG: hypothetical protein PQJ60_07020 [Spirochaetales bacterium]|nr:hypothetical protein [Spirochaetales bacterium]